MQFLFRKFFSCSFEGHFICKQDIGYVYGQIVELSLSLFKPWSSLLKNIEYLCIYIICIVRSISMCITCVENCDVFSKEKLRCSIRIDKVLIICYVNTYPNLPKKKKLQLPWDLIVFRIIYDVHIILCDMSHSNVNMSAHKCMINHGFASTPCA